MKPIILNPERALFTDPVYFDPKRWIMFAYLCSGKSMPEPFVIPDNGDYLVFGGNHRIYVARRKSVRLIAEAIENDRDLMIAQALDGRKLPKEMPIQFDVVRNHLRKRAEEHHYKVVDAYCA